MMLMGPGEQQRVIPMEYKIFKRVICDFAFFTVLFNIEDMNLLLQIRVYFRKANHTIFPVW